MEWYPDVLRHQIDNLNSNLAILNNSTKSFVNSSNKLQKKLVFWTKVMAGAIILQAIAIVIQIYFSLK